MAPLWEGKCDMFDNSSWFTRYNPSLKQNIASAYRPWFIVGGILCFIVGICIIAISAIMYATDNDIKNEMFHLWIGIPLLVFGILAIVPAVQKGKTFATVILILSLIIMVICATGAVVTGLRYWMDHWQQAKNDLDDDKCSVVGGKCVCPTVSSAMPSSVDTCDDLELLVNLVIAEIALCSAGFIASIFVTYLSFMAICCGPWMYIEWYEEENDPDFSSGNNVRQTNSRPTNGQINSAYGNPTYYK